MVLLGKTILRFDTQMKKALLILTALVSLIIANTARAAIGWSLDDCKHHWGDVVETLHGENLRDPRSFYSFQFQGLYITVALLNDQVSYVNYRGIPQNIKTGITDITLYLQANVPSNDGRWVRTGTQKGDMPGSTKVGCTHYLYEYRIADKSAVYVDAIFPVPGNLNVTVNIQSQQEVDYEKQQLGDNQVKALDL